MTGRSEVPDPSHADDSVYVSVHQPVLGTVLELRIGGSAQVAAAAEERVLATIDEFERRFTVHDPGSELCRWRAGELDRPSADLVAVLAQAERWHRASDGAFHPATAEVSARWRAAATEDLLPTDDELDQLAESLRRLPYEVVDGVLRRTGDSSSVDLNALAKGWIVDRAVAAAMSATGAFPAERPRSVVVNAGGDLVHVGEGSVRVGIEDPRRPHDNAPPLDRVVLAGEALATSGTARRGVRIAGRWYGHVIDPRTARPTSERTRSHRTVCSSSVIAGDAATADAVATVLSVLDPDEGLAFVASMSQVAAASGGVACCIVTDDGEVHVDDRWRAHRPEG